MARCSCAGTSCSCSIVQGNGIQVQGTGSASAPFIISVSPQLYLISVAADGVLDLSSVGGYATVQVTLDANATTVLLPPAGPRVDVLVKQGVGGSHTIAWPAAVLFPGGTDPVLSTATGAIDWITLVNTGTIWAGVRTAANLS